MKKFSNFTYKDLHVTTYCKVCLSEIKNAEVDVEGICYPCQEDERELE